MFEVKLPNSQLICHKLYICSKNAQSILLKYNSIATLIYNKRYRRTLHVIAGWAISIISICQSG